MCLPYKDLRARRVSELSLSVLIESRVSGTETLTETCWVGASWEQRHADRCWVGAALPGPSGQQES